MPLSRFSENDRAIVGHRRSPVVFRAAAWLALALGVLAPAHAAAAEGIWMRWNDCAPGGISQLPFECTTPAFQRSLFVSAALAGGLGQVVGASTVIDLVSDPGTLPDWWRLGIGECRAGKLGANTDFSLTENCVDAWSGLGTGLVAWIGTRPGSAPNQVRFVVTSGVAGVDAATLPDAEARAVVRVFIYLSDSATSPCVGCTLGACFVANSVEFVCAPGAPVAGATLAQAGDPDSNFALWQSGAGCVAVPARNRSWGQIKALYH